MDIIKNRVKCILNESDPDYILNKIVNNQIILNQITKLNPMTINNISEIEIGIIFHYIADNDNYCNIDLIRERANEIILSLNDDFNNYSENIDSLNCAKYSSIIHRVFFNNHQKIKTYLSDNYLNNVMPKYPIGIKFKLIQIYNYKSSYKIIFPQKCSYSIGRNIIKEKISEFGANAIYPNKFINIWIFDSNELKFNPFWINQSYSWFPWEYTIDLFGLNTKQHVYYWGIYIHKSIFFPESNKMFTPLLNGTTYKCITHSLGHFFGLIHKTENNVNEKEIIPMDYDVCKSESKLFIDLKYNPDFTNFMTNNIDKNMCHFDPDQMYKMKFFIIYYYPEFLQTNIINK